MKLLSLLVFSLLSLQCFGWWDTGHMIVSEIAWKHLSREGAATPETLDSLKNAITSIVTYANDSDDFVTAACWMDDLKKRNMQQFSNWHFINLPICEFPDNSNTEACNNISVKSIFASGNQDGNFAVWAINNALTTIKGSQALGFERGFALRNLLHIVGDLHQPLHAVALFSPAFPTGDLGGNLFKVNATWANNNLHAVWDSGMGLLNNFIYRPLNSSSSNYISDMADKIMQYTANLTSAINITSKDATNVTAWAMESREVAMEYVYTNISYNSVPSDYYITRGWDVVQNRLGLAGFRLYLLVKQIHLCNDQNCPVSEKTIEHKESSWRIVGIVLAAVLGVSLLLNIILIVKRRRDRYHTIN